MTRVRFQDATRVRAGSPKSARAGYDRQNQLCANLILSDPLRYGGESSLAVQWAALVIENSARRVEGPLFAKVAA